MQKKVSSQRLQWSSNWFPPFWLSFLILGMPCENSAYRSKLIMSGAVSKLADDPHARLKQLGNKLSRRQAKKAGGGVEGENNAGDELSMTGSSAGRTINHVVSTTAIKRDSIDIDQARIISFQTSVSVLTSLLADDAENQALSSSSSSS